MRYQPLSSSFYIQNRKAFCEKMSSNSVAILVSNDSIPTNADGLMDFNQNTDLLLSTLFYKFIYTILVFSLRSFDFYILSVLRGFSITSVALPNFNDVKNVF